MTAATYRYTFSAIVPIEDVQASLLLACWGTEALHGEAQTRLDAAHHFATEHRTCTIDASTEVGRTLNRLFTGFLRREFMHGEFQIERQVATRTPEEAVVPS